MSSVSGHATATPPLWRERAVGAVIDALYARHPWLADRFGQRGLKACSEDVHRHLDYLDAALATGEAALFADYALWLKVAEDSRGVPGGLLAESFELLAASLATCVPAADAERARLVLAAGRDALQRDDLHPVSYERHSLPALPDTAGYVQAAVSGNQRAAAALMADAMQAGYSFVETAVRLIQPAMYEVGRQWQENLITVAQEHLATAVSESVLARSYSEASFAPPLGRSAFFACAGGNLHSFGLRMLADAFETVGWDAAYFGADVPAPDLIRQVDAGRPDLLCLSISLPGQLPLAHETIGRLRADLGSRAPTLWVGGLATSAGERIWRALHADGWAADALHALRQIAP